MYSNVYMGFFCVCVQCYVRTLGLRRINTRNVLMSDCGLQHVSDCDCLVLTGQI